MPTMPLCCMLAWSRRLCHSREARDSLLRLMKICQKLDLSFWHYLGDRLGIGDGTRLKAFGRVLNIMLLHHLADYIAKLSGLGENQTSACDGRSPGAGHRLMPWNPLGWQAPPTESPLHLSEVMRPRVPSTGRSGVAPEEAVIPERQCGSFPKPDNREPLLERPLDSPRRAS